MADKLVTIAQFPMGSDSKAHIAKMQLESDGIEAVIIGEDLLAVLPYCGHKPIELQVLSSKAEEAIRILESSKKQEQ